MKPVLENEKPNAKWANWALLNEWDKNTLSAEERAEVGAFIAERLRETQEAATGRGKASFVITTSDGYWSRGEHLPDAARKCGGSKTARAMAWVVLNDATAEVSPSGTLIGDSGAMIICLGVIGTVGSVARADRPNG